MSAGTDVPVRLAKYGDMTEGEIVAWLVDVGSSVSEGDELVEIEMAKATVVVESPATGTVTALLYGPGAVVPVGATLAMISVP